MQVLLTHLGYQYDAIETNTHAFPGVREQAKDLQDKVE
jgi:hypothetical protein